MSDCVEIESGHLSFLFDRDTLFVRRVRWKGVEVVRAIYPAVRDRNWATVPARLEELEVDPATNETRIQFRAKCNSHSISYLYFVKICAYTSGELRVEFSGEAQSDFLRNRIGLCVLHPIALCSGRNCAIEHISGITEKGRFPTFVAPHQPFKEIRKLRHAIDEHTDVEFAFSGEIFEMEDQRNWTDSSFKTYGTPLSLPFPQQVRRGDKVEQTVAIRFLERAATDFPSSFAPFLSQESSPSEIVLRTDFGKTRPKPILGFGASASELIPENRVLEALRMLHCDHVQVDCRLWETDWQLRFEREIASARQVGARLHVAVFSGTNPREELRAISELGQELGAPITLWLVFARDRKCTPPELVSIAKEILSHEYEGTPIACGTDANFVELNRERPPMDAGWHPCFSVNPQVHASDEMSIMENIDAQADVVRSAAKFSNRSVVISPITLRSRFNPNSTETGLPSRTYDPRQSSLFAARWTHWSLALLAREPNIHSLTYFETFGPGGIMNAAGLLYPVYHVFAGVGELSVLAEACVDGCEDGVISVIAGTNDRRENLLFAANHSDTVQTVRLESATDCARVRVRKLGEENVTSAANDPSWWKNSSSQLCEGRQIQLPPRGIVRLELL